MIFTFSGSIAHFIDNNWNLVEWLVDFHEVGDKEHAGVYAAKAFVKSAADCGSLKKICQLIYYVTFNSFTLLNYFLAIVMDNASNCDTLARILGVLLMERYGIPFHSNNAHIRCLSHVVNIVVQTILKNLNEADDPDVNDWYEANKNLPIHYDADMDPEQQEMELNAVEDGLTEINEVMKDELPKDASTLSNIKKVCIFQMNQANIHILCLPASYNCPQDLLYTTVPQSFSQTHEEEIPQDNYKQQRHTIDGTYASEGHCDLVELHSCYDMQSSSAVKGTCHTTDYSLKVLIYSWQAIDKWVFYHKKMRVLLLTDKQWQLLEQLTDILDVNLLAYLEACN